MFCVQKLRYFHVVHENLHPLFGGEYGSTEYSDSDSVKTRYFSVDSDSAFSGLGVFNGLGLGRGLGLGLVH